MDFLTTALYSRGDRVDEALAGAILTRFDEEGYGRPQVYYAEVEELRKGVGKLGPIAPRGFLLDEQGVLLSDTTCRSVFNESVTSYIEQEVHAHSDDELGLIDFIFAAIESGATIVQNYTDLYSGKESTPVMVSFNTLKVSNSSFNVYTPYQNSDGYFRTLSLVDITNDQSIPFVVALTDEQCSLLRRYQPRCMQPVAPIERVTELQGLQLFNVNAPLLPTHNFMGEAFVHYLAYNVAYYSMGMRTIDRFLEDNKYKLSVVEEPRAPYERKKPLHNVRIEHVYKELFLNELLSSFGNREAMIRLLQNHPEVNVTLDWVQTVFNSKPADCDWNSDIMCQSCLQLKYSARAKLLRFALELLAQRYYICQAGFIDDTLPDILKGGGVGGSAIKRSSW